MSSLPHIPEGLVGTKHTFPDGDSIMIFEIKLRDRLIEGEGIEGITMSYNEFLRTYGHLFPAMSGTQE